MIRSLDNLKLMRKKGAIPAQTQPSIIFSSRPFTNYHPQAHRGNVFNKNAGSHGRSRTSTLMGARGQMSESKIAPENSMTCTNPVLDVS